MLRMQSRSKGYAEGLLRIFRIGEDQCVALILMRDLVERAQQPDPPLDCEEAELDSHGDSRSCTTSECLDNEKQRAPEIPGCPRNLGKEFRITAVFPAAKVAKPCVVDVVQVVVDRVTLSS